MTVLDLPPQPAGRLVQADDVTYHIIDLGAGPATLMLHGGGPGSSGWTDFGVVTDRFASDRRCILVDLLQYGQSSKAAVSGPMWSFHAARLLSLLDALDLDRVDLVCNSWGGSMGLCLAAAHPERVRSVAVTGCVPVLEAPPGLLQGTRRGRAGRNRYYGGNGPSPEKMRDLMADLEWFDATRIPDSTVALRHIQSLDPEERARAALSDSDRGDPEDLTVALREIRCPALFAWGMHDRFVPPEYALMLARLTPSGQVHVFDRTSHHPQEERPDLYAMVLRAFLSHRD